jgi:hypothetical protein
MDMAEKLIVALENPSTAACYEFVAWTRAIAVTDAIDRAEVEHLDDDTQRLHTTKPARFFAFASLWLEPDAASDVVAALPNGVAWFRVRERLAFDRSARPDEARVWAGVKKTTPWTPVDGIDARTWQGRYTNHGYVAMAHHATCVRYRQNVVIAGSDPLIGAVSELWWTSTEDLVERFYRSEEAKQLVAIDAGGFVDARRAYPTVTRHETIRVGNATTSDRGFI